MSRTLYHVSLFIALSCALIVHAAPALATPLLVANVFTSSVDLYDTDGTLLQANFIPSFGGGMVLPANIITGPDGNIYVSSNLTGHVLKYNRTDGAPLGIVADLGSSSAPSGLAFDPSGRLFVADHGSNAVRVFDNSSTTVPVQTILIPTAAPLQQGGGIAFDDSFQRLYISSFGTSEVFVYNNQGTPTLVDDTMSVFADAFEGGLMIPAGVEVGPDGSVYVANIFGNSVSKFLANGTPVDGAGGPGTPFITIPNPPFEQPIGIAFPGFAPGDVIFDTNGDLLISLLGPTNPTETPYPLGGLVRFSASTGELLDVLAHPINSTSSLALLEDVEAVPEPSTYALGLMGIMLFSFACWKRRR
ncbi:MAG: NHL repeat-containing protein [Planctomycetes bacterium]|nr:NHL repeat-containing protein [Planctomycetota bacterium]